MYRYKIQTNEKINSADSSASSSLLLSLSLFIILLAFFIILTTLSNFSEDKVDEAFDSLDLAFAQNLIENNFEQKTNDDRSKNKDSGQGDTIEDVEGVLKSILPGLNIQLTDGPNNSKTMAIRIKKDQFDRVASRLIPVFVRILNIKDVEKSYNLSLISYTQNPLLNSAIKSHSVIQKYYNNIIKQGIDKNRLNIIIDSGNPAYFQFEFNNSSISEAVIL